MERQLKDELPLPPACDPWNANLRTICTDLNVAQNVVYALNTGYPEFGEEAEPHGRTVSICGSAPSLKKTYKNLTGDIWACNDAGWFLIDNGVVPKYVMVWDPQPLVVDCLRKTHPDTTYLVASMCDPSVFGLLKSQDRKVVIWHPWMGDALPMLDWLTGAESKSRLLVGYGLEIPICPPGEVWGTSAAVTRSAQFAPLMGYRDIHLHGVDSSCEEGLVHFDDLGVDRIQWREPIWLGLDTHPATMRKFLSTPQMNRQIHEFIPLVRSLHERGVTVKVHGSGAIPWVAMLRGWHVNNVGTN